MTDDDMGGVLMEFDNIDITEDEILPLFSLDTNIIHKLAYIKRKLRSIAINTNEDYTQNDAISLQDTIDDIVTMYCLDCVDDFIFN